MYRFRLKQCHHCFAFDHLRPFCPFLNHPKPCFKCGVDGHRPTDCPYNLCCINCNGHHHAFSNKCPHYHQNLQDAKLELLHELHINTVPDTSQHNQSNPELLKNLAQNAPNPTSFLDTLYNALRNEPLAETHLPNLNWSLPGNTSQPLNVKDPIPTSETSKTPHLPLFSLDNVATPTSINMADKIPTEDTTGEVATTPYFFYDPSKPGIPTHQIFIKVQYSFP